MTAVSPGPHTGDSSRPGAADALLLSQTEGLMGGAENRVSGEKSSLLSSALPAPYFAADGITLYHGSCLDILPLIDRVDVTLTDPPYARDVYQRLGLPDTHAGSGTPGRMGGGDTGQRAYLENKRPVALGLAGTFDRDNRPRVARLAAGAIGFIDAMLEDVAREIARLTARWSLVFSDVETCHRWREQLELGGMRYVRTGAWVKDDPMPQFSGDRPAVGFEPCTITHAQGPMHWNGGGMPAVWRYGTVKRNRPDHPCPKPLDLMRDLVRLFSDPGEVILDPFAGASTTLLAARIEGRRAIGIEIDERFAAVSARRLERGDAGARQPQQGMMTFEVSP